MKVVYICSRFNGDEEVNIENAKKYAKFVLEKGFLPICVHCFLEDITGLREENDRELLIINAMNYLTICEEIWIFGTYLSEGMRREMIRAKELGLKIVYISDEEIKDLEKEV